jgi:hypothetical protein
MQQNCCDTLFRVRVNAECLNVDKTKPGMQLNSCDNFFRVRVNVERVNKWTQLKKIKICLLLLMSDWELLFVFTMDFIQSIIFGRMILMRCVKD